MRVRSSLYINPHKRTCVRVFVIRIHKQTLAYTNPRSEPRRRHTDWRHSQSATRAVSISPSSNEHRSLTTEPKRDRSRPATAVQAVRRSFANAATVAVAVAPTLHSPHSPPAGSRRFSSSSSRSSSSRRRRFWYGTEFVCAVLKCLSKTFFHHTTENSQQTNTGAPLSFSDGGAISPVRISVNRVCNNSRSHTNKHTHTPHPCPSC